VAFVLAVDSPGAGELKGLEINGVEISEGFASWRRRRPEGGPFQEPKPPLCKADNCAVFAMGGIGEGTP